MTDEMRKQICRAVYYEYDVEKIAKIESITEEEVNDAVTWGNNSGYFSELETGFEEVDE